MVSSICFKISAFMSILLQACLSSHIFSTTLHPPQRISSQWAREVKARQNGIQAELAIPVLACLLGRLV